MNFYPDAKIQEDGGVTLMRGDDHVVFIPDAWIEGPPLVTPEDGYHHRITLTVFVEDITIKSGARFIAGRES